VKIIKVEKKTVQTGWLKKRFGDCVSQLSVDTKLKLKSAIKDTHRALHGTVYPEIEKICKQFPTSPQGVDEHDVVFGYHDEGTWVPGLAETNPTLKQYIKDYPEEWNIVQKSLGLARQASRHPCAYIISPTPVDSFVPIVTVGGVRVTQFTANAIESAGGLKMDFLVVNSIKDIEECIKIIRKTNPGLPSTSKLPSIMLVSDPVTGEKLNIYDLPEDPEVYKDICEGKVETVFQLDASAARTGLQSFRPVGGKPPIKDITGLAAFVALDRPGPLDAYVEENGVKHNMLVEYARRAAGEAGIGRVAILDELLPETYGVLVFQEQLTKVFRLLGNTTGAEADNFRVHTSKKQLAKVLADRSVFMNGAIPKLGQQTAERLWEMMVTFANYGFCIDGDQKIVTNVGPMRMEDLVKSKEEISVLSLDTETNQTEYIIPSAKFSSGIKEVFEIELEDGSTIKATEDHKFLYQGEWVTLKDLILNKDTEVFIQCQEESLATVGKK